MTMRAVFPVHLLAALLGATSAGLAGQQEAQAPSRPSGPESAPLRGTVLLPDGAPAAGAAIEARRFLLQDTNALDIDNIRRPSSAIAAKCDDRGCFSIDLPAGLPFELHVAADKAAKAILPRVYSGEQVDVRLLRPGHLEGVLTRADTGVPVAGATVRVRKGSIELFHGSTDAAGHWFAANLMPESITVEVWPQDAVAPPWPRLELTAGRTLRLDLTVQEGETLRGSVVDAATGKPVAGAEVGDSWAFGRRVVTAADGRYELKGLRDGEVHVRASGYGRQGLQRSGDTLDIALEPGRRVRGTLVDAADEPLAGIYVAATADEQIDWVPATTAADGTFALDSLRRDVPHCLYVRGDGWATLVYDFPADEKQRDEIDFGRIAVPRAVYVTGTIADEHGRPIAGAPVTLAGTNSDRARFGGAGGHERGGFYVNRRGTRTDSLGRFHLRDVAPGHYKLEARVDELEDRLVGSSSVEAQPLSLQVGRQAAREQEDFVIPLGRQLVGRVMAPSGAVPPSVTITYTVDGASDGHKPLLVRPGKTFRLFRLSEGELALEAAPCSYLGEPLPTEGGPRGVVRHAVRSLAGTVWICLEEDGWVQAFVVDGNGAPVPGARVAVLGADGREIASRASDARGSAAFFVGKAAEVTVVAEPQHADGVAGGAGSGVTAVKSPVVKAGTSNVELVLR